MKILLLEDDDTLRALLAECLASRGYEVEAVARGDDAIDRARSSSFDLVVADVRMEGTDGLTALDQVQHQHPGISSIVITGYSTEQDSIRAIRLGVGDYLKKPFRVGEFLEAVERQAARRRTVLEAAERERALLHTAAWGFEQALRSRPEGPSRIEAAQLAEQVALELGTGAETALEARLIVLAEAVEASGAGPPASVWQALPRAIRADSGLSRAVARACLEYCSDGSQEVDAEIQGAIDRVLDIQEPGRAAGTDGLSLLSVARALENSGSRDSARAAYQELVSTGSGRPRVEGLLGLARLDGDSGAALEAVEAARAIGPVAHVRACLEAALALPGDQRARARELAEQACALASRLDMRALGALAAVASAVLGAPTATEEALTVLLEGENQALLAEAGRWVLPWLLEQPGSAAQSALRLLARESPRELSAVVARGGLSEPARRAAAGALASSWGEWAEQALRSLSLDPEASVRQAAGESLNRAAPERPPLLRLFSLGPFEAFHGDFKLQDRQWKSPKVRLLLAFLAAQQGRPVSEDVLQEVFWPDDPVRGRRNLSATLSHLRNNLRPPGWKGELNYILRSSSGVQLNPELPRWHDYEELERAAGEAAEHTRAGRADQARARYRAVLDTYRGPYLEGHYQDWALQRRTRVERLVLDALLALARHAESAGDPSAVLEHAERALEIDPFHQEACLLAMQALVAARRPEEAVRRYESYRRRLTRDLGLEPSLDLVRAHQTALLSV
ncbi:MAG: response regulator [Candidatus Eremiobacterota bacterium]